MAKQRALGKGLGSIISTSTTPVEEFEQAIVEDSGRIIEINVEKVIPNPDQPRTHFDEHEIKGLAESIKSVGLIQPIIVQKNKDTYIVIAGERRLRASKEAGVEKIKAIVMEVDEQENLTLALIENIQRQNLDPIEEAKAYRVMVNRFKLKQADIAKKVGKERATVANTLRLLNLPEDMQEGLSEGLISVGHAKVLLSISNPDKQRDFYTQIVDKGYSVRTIEAMLAEGDDSSGNTAERERSRKSAHIKKMEDKLVSFFGTKVEIRHSGKKGRIEISYYSLEDFERITDLLK